jgi:hypothetical protein
MTLGHDEHMEIEFASKPELDTFLREHLRAAKADDQKLTLRVQPQVYGIDTKQYQGWPDVAWKILIERVEEGRQLKRALDAFFEALGRLGPQKVIETLEGL